MTSTRTHGTMITSRYHVATHRTATRTHGTHGTTRSHSFMSHHRPTHHLSPLHGHVPPRTHHTTWTSWPTDHTPWTSRSPGSHVTTLVVSKKTFRPPIHSRRAPINRMSRRGTCLGHTLTRFPLLLRWGFS